MTREADVRDHAMKLRIVHTALITQKIDKQWVLLVILAVAACLLFVFTDESLNRGAHFPLMCVCVCVCRNDAKAKEIQLQG
jgi:hypothetical protein